MSSDAPAPTNPDDKKPEEPKGLLEKVGAALPVALTALSAVFGSMSNGALQEAMYWKSQAGQDQSKAADQWSFFAAKRTRALIMEGNAKGLRATALVLWTTSGPENKKKPVPVNYPKLDALPPVRATTSDDARRKSLAWLQDRKARPTAELPEVKDEAINNLRKAIAERKPESEVLTLARRVRPADITRAIDDAEKASADLDQEWGPIIREALFIANFTDAKNPDDPWSATSRQAVGCDFEEWRYRAEANLNRGIASLYEVRVKVSSAESDKYRRKSDHLSVAMLVAQIGAVAASLALARKQKSALWLFAGLIGLVAVLVGGYAMIPPAMLPF
ncbi:MAG TPA: hypothetical protein VGE74_02925 [Gemmata sp.]